MPAEMLSAIEKAVKRAGAAADHYREYLERLEYTGYSGREPYKAERAGQLIGLIRGNKVLREAEFLRGEPGSALDAAFKLEYRMQRMRGELEELEETLAPSLPNPEQQYSSSSRTMTPEYHRALTRLLGEAGEGARDYRELLDTIHLETAMVLDGGGLERLQHKYEAYVGKEKGHLVVALYTRSLQRILDTHDDKATGQAVLQQLESVKSAVLQPQGRGAASNRTNGIQLMVLGYGLTPREGQSLEATLNTLLRATVATEATTDKKRDEAQLFQEAAKLLSGDHRVGFIVVDRRTPGPVEYRFPFGHLEAPRTGIDRAFREERTTLVYPAGGGAPATGKGAVRRITAAAGGEADEYYVVDRIAEDRYRVLARGNRPLPAALLENLGRAERWPSARVSGYNQRLEQLVLEHLRSPIVTFPRLSRAETKRDEAYWRNLHARIMERLRTEPGFASGRLTAEEALRVITATLRHSFAGDARGTAETGGGAAQRLYEREMQTTYHAEAEALHGRLRAALADAQERWQENLTVLLPQVLNAKSSLFRELEHKHTILSAALRRETSVAV